MADEAQNRPTPIYVSYLTFTNLLDWLREAGTLPSQFDRSYWGTKFSGSGGAQLMTGLRFLGLLKGDVPTEAFETLALAPDAERRPLILDLLRSVYGTEFIDSLPKATPRLVNDHIASLGTTDATHRKAVSFFVNAAKAVGVTLPSQIAKQARNRPSVSRKPGQKRVSKGGTGDVGGGEGDQKPPLRDKPLKLPFEVHPTLEPLLRDLADKGPSWTSADRNRWKTAFDTLLDYAYPPDGGTTSG